MTFKLRKSTAETLRTPLVCDPAMTAALGSDVLAFFKADRAAYLGDPGFVVPADACLFTVRPLTAAQRVAAIEAAAGKTGASSLTAYAAVALPAAVVSVEQGGETYRIAEFLDAIADDAELIGVLTELVDVVRTMSGLDAVGKAPSAPPRG